MPPVLKITFKFQILTPTLYLCLDALFTYSKIQIKTLELRKLSKEDRRKFILSKESKEPLKTAAVCIGQMASFIGGFTPGVVNTVVNASAPQVLKIAGGGLIDDVVLATKHGILETKGSDVVGEQKLGSGQVQGLLCRFRSGLGIKISGTSPSGFRGFGSPNTSLFYL